MLHERWVHDVGGFGSSTYENVQACDGSRYTVLQYVGGDGTISYMYLNWCVCKSICTVLYKAIDF